LIEEGKIETSFNGALRYGIASGNKAIPKLKTAPKMITCPNCDNKIYENAKVCSYCGLKDIGSVPS
jgi:ribosomal protein L32